MHFYLYIVSTRILTNAMADLSQKSSIERWTRKLNPLGVFTHTGFGDGVVIEAQDILEINRFRAALNQVFHMDPTLKFHFVVDEFHYDKDGNYAGIISTLQSCSALLEELGGDAVLLAANNDVVLRRQSGKVILNTEWGFWNPYRISQISVAYQLQSLPPVRWS